MNNIFKKVILFTIVTFMFFISIDLIQAKTCEYKYSGKTIKLNVTEVENGTASTSESQGASNYKEIVVDAEIPGNYDTKHNFIMSSLFTSADQCLETITVCVYKKNTAYNYLLVGLIQMFNSLLNGEEHIAIFGSILDPSTIDSALAYEFDSVGEKEKNIFEAFMDAWWTGDGVECSTVEYSGADKDDMRKNGKFINYCSKFSSMYSDIAAAYKDYAKCVYDKSLSAQQSSRCKANAFTEINKYVDKLKDTCNNILQHESISVRDGCASSCLGANDTLKTLKERYGLEVKSVNECSISSRLVVWIANIIRWAKYIIPVMVIIFSILSFIKAIGNGKEDEMKKAQGKFIKRLIAAALIFIAPFIIQFVLEKMGFAANGCGIIDL